MLRRIIVGLAIAAALAAVIVNITVIRPKIMQLQQDRDAQRSAKVEAQTELAQTRKTLAATQAELDQTKTQLAKVTSENDDLSHKLAQANTQIQDLTDKLAKTTTQLNHTQDQLAAYQNTGLQPPQIIALDKQLKDTQNALAVANQEKLVLSHTVARLNNQLELLIGKDYVVKLPPMLKGEVMAVDPKWKFVVLNIGENQGVLQSGEMLVSRDGRLVAKVIVSSVQKDRCIANLVPGWQLGDVVEGDEVTPAHPAS